MNRNYKQTAWKKNRRFGDIHGSRVGLKYADGIFKRYHSLTPPSSEQEKPIFIVENTSRDFYFPVTVDEIKQAIKQLPINHTKYLTHIWLSKVKKSDYISGNTLQGEFVCGSNVYLIKLYAFPKDNKMVFGQIKPTIKQLNFYKKYCNDLRHDSNGWYLQWTIETIKKYFLEKLLLHEIGHCVDYIYHRQWSNANIRQAEDFADNYAVIWGNSIKQTIEANSKLYK